MNQTLKRLCTEASKITDIFYAGEGRNVEYFIVEKHNVTVTIEKTTAVPLTKRFECTCEHASLFGNKNDIPCKHIFALIGWLIEAHRNKEE